MNKEVNKAAKRINKIVNKLERMYNRDGCFKGTTFGTAFRDCDDNEFMIATNIWRNKKKEEKEGEINV